MINSLTKRKTIILQNKFFKNHKFCPFGYEIAFGVFADMKKTQKMKRDDPFPKAHKIFWELLQTMVS